MTRAELRLKLRSRLEKERDTLRAQLPDGMKHCTILFKECPQGHGRLTATNWIDHGCYVCKLATAEADLLELREAVKSAYGADWPRLARLVYKPR